MHVEVYLTTSACPKKTEISDMVTRAVADVPGTGAVTVTLDVMNDEQRTELRKQLRGDAREPVIPFAQPGSLTRVYAVASGKGGVGKSSVTVNLAAAMAARGLSVGVLDADIYGHSVPRMMGTTERPTQVESMILPPVAHDVRVISIAMFTQGNTPVVWRGPMLHRALQQFLADVYWGDLDVLLLDLPPGTGDIAISVAQLIPGADILVVTTPQLAAAEVAERAGAIALQTKQRIVGVVENMSGLLLPDGTTMQIFGEGGGKQVAESLSRAVGADVPLLGQVPLDPGARGGGRLRGSAGAVRTGFGGGQGVTQHRRRTVEPQARAGGHVAGPGSRRPLTAFVADRTRRCAPRWHHQPMDSEQFDPHPADRRHPDPDCRGGNRGPGDRRLARAPDAGRAAQARLRRRQPTGRVRERLVERQQADRRHPPTPNSRPPPRRRPGSTKPPRSSPNTSKHRRTTTVRPSRSDGCCWPIPMHRRGARVLRGFYYYVLGMVLLQVSGALAAIFGRADTLGIPNYFSDGQIYVDLLSIFMYTLVAMGFRFWSLRVEEAQSADAPERRITLRNMLLLYPFNGSRPTIARIVYWLWLIFLVVVIVLIVISAYEDLGVLPSNLVALVAWAGWAVGLRYWAASQDERARAVSPSPATD